MSWELMVGILTIIYVNFILSGDNAVVIAMAVRSLPPRQQKLGIFWGAFGAVALRIALPLDVLDLDDSSGDGHPADSPFIAEIVQVKAIRLFKDGLPSFLPSPPMPLLACPVVPATRRTVLETPARLSPPPYSWNLPRAHIRREASRTSVPATDPVWCPRRLNPMGHIGSSLLRSFVDEARMTYPYFIRAAYLVDGEWCPE